MIGVLFIVLMQTIVIAVATTLMVLGNRSQRPIVPFTDAPSFVVHRELMTAEDARHGAAT
jgi:hypothetical protein